MVRSRVRLFLGIVDVTISYNYHTTKTVYGSDLASLTDTVASLYHLFTQNPATNTENSGLSRSEHIFMELTLFVYNINSQYFCIKSGLNYLRYKRYNRNETEGHIFFCNINFHRNGIYILYINCYHHRKIYILH